MSILCCLNPGEARARASEPAREPECNALIVHPLFVSDLTREPETFCPMDWLPDEVITNVLVHVVRGLATTRRASVRETRRDGPRRDRGDRLQSSHRTHGHPHARVFFSVPLTTD